jgi:hypothetical protein
MLTSYSVKCPRDGCGWTGSLIPSMLQGGAHTELAFLEHAWFRCPRCHQDWEVRISEDRVTVVPQFDHGGG